MPEPRRVILLGPLEEDAPATLFNQDVIEAADEASDLESEAEAPAALEASAAPAASAASQRAPLGSLPSRSERRARQAVDREVRAAQRNALLQDSDVIPLQGFLRTSTSATLSHKTAAFLINKYCLLCLYVCAS